MRLGRLCVSDTPNLSFMPRVVELLCKYNDNDVKPDAGGREQTAFTVELFMRACAGMFTTLQDLLHMPQDHQIARELVLCVPDVFSELHTNTSYLLDIFDICAAAESMAAHVSKIRSHCQEVPA